ncbi:MAG: TldD/PmbA family protein [Candidatus Aminicenantia bacterium]
MGIADIAEDILKKTKNLGCEEVEVYIVRRKTFEVNVRNGEIEILRQSIQKGLGLRIFNGKCLGFSYTSDFSKNAIEETIKQTIALTKITEPKPWNSLPEFEETSIPDLDLYDSYFAEIPNENKIRIAREVENLAMKMDRRITNTEGGFFEDVESEIGMFSSKGLSAKFKSTLFSFGVSIIAGEGENMQSGAWSSSKRFYKELDEIEIVAREAVKRAIEKLGPKPVPTKKVPVIFERDSAPMFWLGILISLNGDSALRKTTFLSEYLNSQIASPLITIYDDPTIPRYIASTPIDGEGKVTRKNTIVEKGSLKMFFYDTITARKAKAKVNTITRRGGYSSLPVAGYLNIIVENGTTAFDKLLDLKEGFLCKGLRGFGTDVTTGNFSVGANGFWIENGSIAFPVDGITLGGSTLEILGNIDALANDLELRGNINSPSFRVSEMIVGGKKL